MIIQDENKSNNMNNTEKWGRNVTTEAKIFDCHWNNMEILVRTKIWPHGALTRIDT